VIGGLTPEQRARVEIDRKLEAAGCEFRTATGPADYLLYGDRKALGDDRGQEGRDAAARRRVAVRPPLVRRFRRRKNDTDVVQFPLARIEARDSAGQPIAA